MLLKDRRIFIVDDNLENRAIMQMLLEQEGARTAIDRWGLDTVDRLRRFAPIDVILLDLMFPKNVTGYEVFDSIRAVAAFDEVPIVAVSSMEASVAVPKVKAKGFTGFICKPVEFDLFPKQIVSIIEGQKVWYTGRKSRW